MPVRIQRKRTKGWRMPPNTVSVTRPGPFGNPFKIGGYYMLGDPSPENTIRMSWSRALTEEAQRDERFTKIETAAQAVEFFRAITVVRGRNYFEPLCGKNLACWCAPDQPCHADVLLELANA